MEISDFRLHVQKLMILYGEIWSTHAGDRLGEIFSEDIEYIEKPACVMDGMCSLQKYWREKVQQEKDVKYEALLESFDICEAQSWAWVKFRASFKTSKRTKANQWVARITINSDGLISVFEEYWSAVSPEAVGMEQACLDLAKEMTSIKTDVKSAMAAWEPSPQQRGAESKASISGNRKLAQLTVLDSLIDSVQSYMAEAKITAEAIFVDLPQIELHHFVARLDCIGKSDANTKCGFHELFDYIDSDGDGVITAADFCKAVTTYSVCLRRICITDSLDMSGKFKNLGVLQIGDMVETVGKPVQDSPTGTVRVKCKVPGACEGFVTIIGNQGTAFFRASSPSSDFLAEVHRVLQPAHQKLCELAKDIHAHLATIFKHGEPYYLNSTHVKLLILNSTLQELFEAFGTVETNPFAALEALCGQRHEEKSQLPFCSESITGGTHLAADSLLPEESQKSFKQTDQVSMQDDTPEKSPPASVMQQGHGNSKATRQEASPSVIASAKEVPNSEPTVRRAKIQEMDELRVGRTIEDAVAIGNGVAVEVLGRVSFSGESWLEFKVPFRKVGKFQGWFQGWVKERNTIVQDAPAAVASVEEPSTDVTRLPARTAGSRSTPNKLVLKPSAVRSSPSSSCPAETVPQTGIGMLSSLGAKAKARASKPQHSGSNVVTQPQSKAPLRAGRLAGPSDLGEPKGKQEQPLDDVISDHSTLARAPISVGPNSAEHAYQLYHHSQSVQPYQYYLSSPQYWATACSQFYGALPVPAAFAMGLSTCQSRRDISGFHDRARSKYRRTKKRRCSQPRKRRSAKVSQSSTSTSTSSSSTPMTKRQKKRKGSSQKQRSSSGVSSCTSQTSKISDGTNSDIDNTSKDHEDDHEDHEKHESHKNDTSAHSSGVASQQTLPKELSTCARAFSTVQQHEEPPTTTALEEPPTIHTVRTSTRSLRRQSRRARFSGASDHEAEELNTFARAPGLVLLE